MHIKVMYGVLLVLCLGVLSFAVSQFSNTGVTPIESENITPHTEIISVDTPIPNQHVSSPLTVSGQARGTWFFEGSFPIVIVDWDGRIIGEGIGTAQGEWMTTDYVPFVATIPYTISQDTPYDRGAIILKRDNPSGLPEYDDAREIPILFNEVSP